MAPIAVCRFIRGATMASWYSPAIGSTVAVRSCAAELCSEAWPVEMVCVTIDSSSRVIGSIPDGPRSSNVIRRGMPEGSARMSSARRARRTVQTSLRTSTLMVDGSRVAVPIVRLKS